MTKQGSCRLQVDRLVTRGERPCRHRTIPSGSNQGPGIREDRTRQLANMEVFKMTNQLHH